MKKVKTFTKKFTAKIATLSKLSLNEEELKHFTTQFNETLDVIGSLNKVNTEYIDEAYSVTGLKNVFRKDEVDSTRMLTQKEALSNGKRTYKGFFVVKGIFDE